MWSSSCKRSKGCRDKRMCLRDLNHVNTLAKGHANFWVFVLCIQAVFLHLVVSFCLMSHVALRPSFLFSQLSLSQTIESYSFVSLNQIALNTHCDVVSSLIKILNFQTSVCYVPSFKLISKWVNPNLTSLVDLNKRLIDKLVLVHPITRRRKNDDEKRKRKWWIMWVSLNARSGDDKMITTERMTRNSLQASRLNKAIGLT